MIGACFAAKFNDDKSTRYIETAKFFAEKLITLTDSEGITPSQWNEAPEGEKLIDLIYTMNWTILAFQLLKDLNDQKKYCDIFPKQLQVILNIKTSIVLFVHGECDLRLISFLLALSSFFEFC